MLEQTWSFTIIMTQIVNALTTVCLPWWRIYEVLANLNPLQHFSTDAWFVLLWVDRRYNRRWRVWGHGVSSSGWPGQHTGQEAVGAECQDFLGDVCQGAQGEVSEGAAETPRDERCCTGYLVTLKSAILLGGEILAVLSDDIQGGGIVESADCLAQ